MEVFLSSKLDINVQQVISCCQQTWISTLKNLTEGEKKGKVRTRHNDVSEFIQSLGYRSAIGYLPYTCKDLGSIPSTKRRKKVHTN
jgi:hypothetical protein